MVAAFGPGARGFLVRDLQQHLGATPDGIYGPQTAALVNSTDGCAAEEDYKRIGLSWPSMFRRCLNLASALEGTSFGDCNERDIDGAGLTFGCIGFTTKHYEVQELLRNYLAERPTAILDIEPHRRDEFQRLIAPGVDPDGWNSFAYDRHGYIRHDLKFALRRWGNTSLMRDLQIDVARMRWGAVIRCAEKIGFWSMRGLGFLFDTWVQNGGLRRAEIEALRSNRSGTEVHRMRHALEMLRLRCRPEFRSDVEARKLLFINGEGKLHGHRFTLKAQAFD